ncbi:ZPR1 zinc-finger domain-containing protein [Pisolithus croceorrhizus]|nr:ZPR1 zinc-finger domain-containing protein [Pisolithus croceorrhizus]
MRNRTFGNVGSRWIATATAALKRFHSMESSWSVGGTVLEKGMGPTGTRVHDLNDHLQEDFEDRIVTITSGKYGTDSFLFPSARYHAAELPTTSTLDSDSEERSIGRLCKIIVSLSQSAGRELPFKPPLGERLNMVRRICSLTSAPAGEDSGYDTIIRRHWTRDRVEATARQGNATVYGLNLPERCSENFPANVLASSESLWTSSHGNKLPLYSDKSWQDTRSTTPQILIPYFREVVVVSFWHEYCSAVNNEIQSASTLTDTGIQYTLNILRRADLDRRIIRPEACTVEVPDFELQLPAQGQLTTVEGLLRDITSDLSSDQPDQEIIDAITETSGDEKAIEDEVDEVTQVPSATEKSRGNLVEKAITIKLDDPSGNSSWTFEMYARNAEQNRIFGLLLPEEPSTGQGGTSEEKEADGEGAEGMNEEIYQFMGVRVPFGNRSPKVKQTPLSGIHGSGRQNASIRGYRDNEVKPGAGNSERGKRITLRIEEREGLSRDILKVGDLFGGT